MGSKSNKKIFFIQASGSNSQSAPSSSMREAFKVAQKKQQDPQWVHSQAKLMNHTPSPDDLFVMDEFVGSLYQELRSKGARIVSSYVLLYMQHLPERFTNIPLRDFPIMSQCMRGLAVTVSSVPTGRKLEIERQVSAMCGLFDYKLRQNTNILVTESVLSHKFSGAAKLKIPIVKCQWVDDCWTQYQYQFKQANDPEILDKYRVPLLYGLQITVSGLPVEERDKIQELVKQHGGTFCPALRLNEPNTYLLLLKPEGEKYKHAIQKKIPCLHVNWLNDSIREGYPLEPEAYQVTRHRVESSRTGSNVATSTTATQELTPGSTSSQPPMIPTQEEPEPQNDLATKIKELTEKVDRKVRFLEDCAIYPIGFDDRVVAAIKQACRDSGAFHVDHFNSKFVSHVIVGPKATPDQLEECEGKHMVKITWLLDSLEEGTCANPTRYRFHKPKESNKLDILSMDRKNLSKYINFDKQPSPPQVAPKKDGSESNDEDEYEMEFKWEYVGNGGANKQRDNQFSSLKRQRSQEEQKSVKSTREGFEELYSTTRTTESSSNRSNPSDISTGKIPANNDQWPQMDLTDDDLDDIVQPNSSKKSHSLEATQNLVKPEWMFSGFEPEEKLRLSEEVKKAFGVNVQDGSCVVPGATHLILYEPYGTEKVFAAISAGMWLMRPQYVTDSLKQRRLLAEDNYEWGSYFREKEASLDSKLRTREKLMISAQHWRIQVKKTGKRIFEQWCFLVLNQRDKLLQSTINILTAGGAEIYYIDDYVNKLDLLEGIKKRANLALIDLKTLTKPRLSKREFLTYVAHFYQLQQICTTQYVTQYIIQTGSMTGGRGEDKWFSVNSISYEQIKDRLAQVTDDSS